MPQKRYIDLRSDTVTRPSPGMRKAIFEAEVGDDVLGDDPTVKRLEIMVATLLGKEEAVYVPSGTMGNQVALKSLTSPGEEVILDVGSHIYNNEAGAASALSGLQLHPIKGERGILSSVQILQEIRPLNIHHPQTALVVLENTHNSAGGTIYPLEVIQDVHKVAKEHNLKMHLDGARLWNASVATGIPLKEYAKYFDSVSVCLSKGLGAPIGSVVSGNPEFIKRARRNRKMFGGGMRQVGIIAAAGIYAVENNIERLADDHKNAKILAEALAKLEGINIDMETVQTNMVIFEIKDEKKDAFWLVEKLKENDILTLASGKKKMRLVTHLDVNEEDIQKTIEVFERVFKQ
ncbi:MAG: low-specificity L-threonine aldolase [candidate division Zixibacteria bacterium]|nr:low-specificity L-threonine aldolase [candidate division Zixibacteria bacterium]